jgi:hypothetical protein
MDENRTKRPRVALAALLIPTLMATPTRIATAASVDPDRPDEANSSQCIPVGTFQLEGGGTWASAVPSANLTLPTLARLGMLPTLELRLETSTWTWQAGTGSGTRSGITPGPDLSIGGKWHGWDGNWFGIGVAAGLLGMVAIGRQPGGVEGDVTLALDLDLAPDTTLGLNARTTLGRPPNNTLAMSWGRAMTDTVSGFIEWVVTTENTSPGHLLDLGTKWLIEPRTMLDTMLRLRIGPVGDLNWSVGAGATHRWD